MAQIDNIIKSLEDTFFGEEYLKYLTLITDVISCRSIKDFRRLKIDFKSLEVENVFANNLPKPEAKEVMTKARAEQIFQNVKAVRANTQFI